MVWTCLHGSVSAELPSLQVHVGAALYGPAGRRQPDLGVPVLSTCTPLLLQNHLPQRGRKDPPRYPPQSRNLQGAPHPLHVSPSLAIFQTFQDLPLTLSLRPCSLLHPPSILPVCLPPLVLLPGIPTPPTIPPAQENISGMPVGLVGAVPFLALYSPQAPPWHPHPRVSVCSIPTVG